MLDITGKRFGKLVVLSADHKDKRGEWFWRCQCDCGNETVASSWKIRNGKTTSCGCVKKAWMKKGPNHSHGMTNTRLYTIWCNMKARCNNPKSYEYPWYGGKGVCVCDDWMAFEPFSEWALNNGYSENLTIDRIDVSKNYCPENCRWINYAQQSLNRTDNHKITAFGKTQTMKEWSDETGIKYDTIERRINKYKWPPERAVSEIATPGRRKKT